MTKRKNDDSVEIADEQLIELFWERDEKAIQATDTKYGKFLFRIANNILHDRQDCEECQNDTYLGIWNSIPPTIPRVFPAFIAKLIRNIAIDKYKKKTRKMRIPSEMTVALDELRDTVCAIDFPEIQSSELGRLINEYVNSLPERQKYIFIGRFYMGDKLSIIADKLNLNVSTVSRETEKIKQGLRDHLERSGIYV